MEGLFLASESIKVQCLPSLTEYGGSCCVYVVCVCVCVCVCVHVPVIVLMCAVEAVPGPVIDATHAGGAAALSGYGMLSGCLQLEFDLLSGQIV